MKFYITCLLIFLQMFCYENSLNAQSAILTNDDLNISIEPQISNGLMTVVGHVENLTKNNFDLKYRLTVIHRSKNYSRNRQTNNFRLESLSKMKVGKVVVGYNSKFIFDIRLEIFQDTNLISFMEINNEMEKEIIGTGLLIDDTRSKNGNDFYGLFNKHWVAADLKTDAMIKIKEKPGRSRSTQILLFVNDELIIQRMLYTRFAQIEEQAEWAFNVIDNYLRQNPSANNPTDTDDLLGNGLN